MNPTTVGAVCAGSILLAIAAFWSHVHWAGTGERVGCFSLVAFVFGWLCVLTGLVTGSFLLLHH